MREFQIVLLGFVAICVNVGAIGWALGETRNPAFLRWQDRQRVLAIQRRQRWAARLSAIRHKRDQWYHTYITRIPDVTKCPACGKRGVNPMQYNPPTERVLVKCVRCEAVFPELPVVDPKGWMPALPSKTRGEEPRG